MDKYTFSHITASLQEFIDVVVIAGQSNAMGQTDGVAPSAPYDEPNNKALIRGYVNSAFTQLSEFSPMIYANGTLLGEEHGAEASLAYNYIGKRVYIVKCTHKGTSLEIDWAIGSNDRTYLIDNLIYAKDFFKTNGINVRWHWYWNQWESDANITLRADNYNQNYRSLWSDVEGVGINFSTHVFHKVNLNSNSYINYPTDAQKILDFQNLFTSEQSNRYILNADDLSLYDNVHYTSSGQIEIGNRLYNIINQ